MYSFSLFLKFWGFFSIRLFWNESKFCLSFYQDDIVFTPFNDLSIFNKEKKYMFQSVDWSTFPRFWSVILGMYMYIFWLRQTAPAARLGGGSTGAPRVITVITIRRHCFTFVRLSSSHCGPQVGPAAVAAATAAAAARCCVRTSWLPSFKIEHWLWRNALQLHSGREKESARWNDL